MTDGEKNRGPYNKEGYYKYQCENDYHSNVKGYPEIYKIACEICYIE